LFFRSNRVTTTDNRITAILACLRERIAGIYAQKKLDQIEDKKDIQDWKNIKEYWSRSILDKVTRRMGNSQCVQ